LFICDVAFKVDALEDGRFEILCEKASVIQRLWRRYKHQCERERLLRLEAAATTIQRVWRKYNYQQRVNVAAVVVQKSKL